MKIQQFQFKLNKFTSCTTIKEVEQNNERKRGRQKKKQSQNSTQENNILEYFEKKITRSSANKDIQKHQSNLKSKFQKEEPILSYQILKQNNNLTAEIVKKENKYAQTDAVDIDKKEIGQSRSNMNLCLSNIEKKKIDLIAQKLKVQINSQLSLFKSTQVANDTKLNDDLTILGYATKNGIIYPYIQPSPFFIAKENLSIKNQIIFEQLLNENGGIEENLIKQNLNCQVEESLLIQKVLHKLQQYFNKQRSQN
ncbi:hypothetical protein ABPG74_006720 [Tetrahymena malaccensis]